MKRFLILAYVLVLFGCGGGGGDGSATPTPLGAGSFWAVDFTTNGSYIVNATKVGEGTNCQIYLENGRSVSSAAISALISEFDSTIYPNLNAAFGGEPNPGIDGDPKIYILLLNIRDGFNPATSSSFIAGYFNPASEYPLSQNNQNSNEKEILFMNVNPAVNFNPTDIAFLDVIAHEFQHMIHWEQKTRVQGVNDDSWLDEAMSQIARTYCGYGPDYAAVFAYEHDLSLGDNRSLTDFDESLGSYGMVYMWAQYFKDRIGDGIFNTMLRNGQTGINSVNAALAAAGSAGNFDSTFRDWAIANYFGDGTSTVVPSGNPAWSYTSINTWPGVYIFNNGQDNVTLPGLFPFSRQNQPALQPLGRYSAAYYSFTPANPGATTGTVTWTRNASTTAASFINGNTPASTVTFDMISGAPNPFTNTGYLIYANPSLISYLTPAAPVDTVAHTAVKSVSGVAATVQEPAKRPRTAREVLAEANASPIARAYMRETGRPFPVHVGSTFREKEKELRDKGIRPGF